MVRRACHAVAILGCTIFAACFGNSDSGTGGAFCDRAVARLRACDLVSAGHFNCSEPEDAEDRCEADCFISSGCDDLELLVCDEQASVEGPPSAALMQCIEACRDVECDSSLESCGAPDFLCGSGELIGSGSVCDGFADCADGSDEAGCPSFTCDDGSVVPIEWRCDQGPDCPDGSDEDGCAQILCGGVPRDRGDSSGGSSDLRPVTVSTGPCAPGQRSVPGAPDDPCPQTGTSCAASGGVATATCGPDGRWPPITSCLCMASANCGNGVIDPGELCDGASLGGVSCASLNGVGSQGSVTCNLDCAGFATMCSTPMSPSP